MKQAPPIVLIDDDRAWLETLADFFEDKGYPVRAAQEGRAGLALLEQGDAGLAIVDFQMPEINGLELLRRLRRGGRDLDVLIMSSDDDPSLPGRALAAGARAFLSKTMEPAALLRTLLRTVSMLGPPAKHFPLVEVRWERRLPAPRRVKVYLPILASFFDPRRN